MILAAALFLILSYGVIDGAVYLCRHEAARRRAARYVFPPTRVIETVDEIPF